MKKLLIKHPLLIIVILFITFTSNKASADIDVSNWQKFEEVKGYYLQNKFFAEEIQGSQKLDLRSDINYLGYRGENIQEDIYINNKLFDITKVQKLTKTTDEIKIRKIGLINGKYVEARIYPTQVPMEISVMDPEGHSLLEFNTLKNNNASGNNHHINLYLYYEGTNERVPDGKLSLLPFMTITGWKTYILAVMVNSETHALIGDQGRDIHTLAATRVKTEPNYSKLAVGGATSDNTPYFYNFLFHNSSIFHLGIQGSSSFSNFAFGLFEPIKSESSIPKPYNDIFYIGKDNKDGYVANQIIYRLPLQDKETFIPANLELDLYKNKEEGLAIEKPFLYSDNKLISETEYDYEIPGKIQFSKSFLKKYSGKDIYIDYKTKIDYNNGKVLENYYDAVKKEFIIPYSLKVTSYFDSFSQIEIDDEQKAVVSYPLKLTGTDVNAHVEIGTKTSDYKQDDFITDVISNFPNDIVKVNMPIMLFSELKEEVIVPVTLTSQKLQVSQTLDLKVIPYKNIKVIYGFQEAKNKNMIQDSELPKNVKQYYNTPISFQVPEIFNNYRLKQIEPNNLSITQLGNNVNEIHGYLNEQVKEIKLIYELSEVEVTIEYLVDGLGDYETHLPVKTGDQLDQNKENLSLKGTISTKMQEFLNKNESNISPDIAYYQKNSELGRIAYNWHYSKYPVGVDNPSLLITEDSVIPNDDITITAFYQGKVSLDYIDNLYFGKNSANFTVYEIHPRRAVNYRFIDTTSYKGNSITVKFKDELLNENSQPLTSFSFMFNDQLINNQSVEVINELEQGQNVKQGDLRNDFVFKRLLMKPENVGEFKGTLMWLISNTP